MSVTFFEPLPCTAGYGSTTYRNGLDTSPTTALNTKARCASPPSSGKNVRGSANAPSGGPVPDPVRPGPALPGALGLPTVPGSPADLGGLLGLEAAHD
jgi:phospholipid/cholesterol/gamma-HCH transport system substrate-binding protein